MRDAATGDCVPDCCYSPLVLVHWLHRGGRAADSAGDVSYLDRRSDDHFLMQKFELPIVVLPEDIDENNHVNNVVFLRWVYEVALAHWNATANTDVQASYGWVATRHELDYRREALLGDPIVAQTWIGAVDSRRFERFTEIIRTSDQAVLARGRTYWCLMSKATGKVTRIPSQLTLLFADCLSAVPAPASA